jgi:ABC-2 type transport system ATP-binding protein
VSETVAPAKISSPKLAVVVRDVAKSFPVSLNLTDWIRYRGSVPRRTVLHDISLSVHTGELYGLLGANGAGKTTLLKMLATLCIADRGQILISGIDANKRPMAVKQRIGLCTSEERSFYYRLTARDNLRFFGALTGLVGDELETRVEEVVGLVDLSEAIDRRFDTFSSGMRQRLALARALLGDPDIIFFDEPTRAVDPLHAREIRSLIRDELVTRLGKTGVLATNSLEEAWAICDTVAILHEGRIVTTGAPRDLDRRFTPFVRYHITLDGASPGLTGALQALGGVLGVTSSQTSDGITMSIELDPSASSVNEVFNAVAESGVRVRSFRSEDPQPLDVFVGFTTNGIDN